MNNCYNCYYCWRDDSVNDRECKRIEEMTEEEAVKYYEDLTDGCPYFKKEENIEYMV